MTETEDLNTLEPEAFVQTHFNLVEALDFFENESESGMFKIAKRHNAAQDRVVTLRKYNVNLDG